MYGVVLILHSWNRWLVLVFAIATLAVAIQGRFVGREWTKTDQRLSRLFISTLDLQVTLGLLLYFVLSPIVPKTMSEFKAAMHVSALRFFAVEHITLMFLALIVAHVASVYGKKASTARARQGRIAWGVALTLLLICAAIPWPWMAAGRPLAHWI
jgi:H+/Cl- antiporter ClcA